MTFDMSLVSANVECVHGMSVVCIYQAGESKCVLRTLTNCQILTFCLYVYAATLSLWRKSTIIDFIQSPLLGPYL